MAKEAEVQDSEIFSSHGGQISTSDIVTDTPLQTNTNNDQQQPLPLPPQIQLQHQLLEPIDPNSCIIIHPGSRNLRLGRPSDSVPFTVLHAIAWRQKNASDAAKRRVDPFIVPLAKMSSDRLQEVEECRLKVSRLLQSSLMSDGARRYATPPKQVSAHNKRVSGELDSTAEPCPELITPTEEYITGSQVSRLSPDAPYHVHFPWQRGDLHCHSGLSGSLNAVVADLDRIWTQAIEEKLLILKNEFYKYGCCVVIPDLYNRDHVARITDLLLTTMGFAACFVFQDHVAATFGSGLGSACVVDVGDQKTSVSCVEDALSIPSTRLRLQYGGSDVSQVLHWLLRKTGFPRPLQPDGDRADAALLADVKHTHCHLDLDMCGPQERRIRVERPGCKPLTYTLQLGDELLITPLSLCYPALLQLTGDKTPVLTQTPNPGHSEDPWDETYLRETSRRGGKETAEVMEVSGAGDGGDEDMVVEDSMPATPTPSTASNSSSNINNSSSYNNINNGKQDGSSSGTLAGLLSLEQAIHTSIERCPEEGRRRMYSTILLVGAGAGFPHLGRWLQGRLLLNIPVCYRPEQVEVITRAKDLEPGMIAWKGAALMTGLEGSGELWISRSLWARQGVRALREKCPFIW